MNQTKKSTEEDAWHPAHDVLFSSADLQERVLNSLQAGVTLIEEATGRVVYASGRWEELTGYTAQDIREQELSLSSLLDDKDRMRLALHLKYPTHKGKGYYLIGSIRHRDGALQSYYLFFSPFEARTGELPLSQVMFLPINSKWELPFTSYDSRELFLELFSSFGFGTFEWNIHSDQVFWSRSIYDIYELPYTSDPILYETIKAYTHPDDVRMARATIQRAMENGGTYEMESRVITPSGNIKTLHIIGKFIRNEQGEVVKLVGSLRNVTELRHQELVMKNQMAELNRSNRELEDFAYVASHDLQEPLRKIITFSERFSEKFGENLDKEAGYYLERINAAAGNMRILIQNLLEFSKVTRNKSFRPVEMAAVIRKVRQDLELILEETGTTFVIDELPVVEGEPAQLQQLFYNLVGNAVKFRRPGVPPVLRFDSAVLSADEKVQHQFPLRDVYHKIVLRDNGIGFEQEYADRIFQIFQRLHGKAEYAGSGIGLAICKKIIDHHKGLIFAEGHPGEGSSFTIIIPEKQPGPSNA